MAIAFDEIHCLTTLEGFVVAGGIGPVGVARLMGDRWEPLAGGLASPVRAMKTVNLGVPGLLAGGDFIAPSGLTRLARSRYTLNWSRCQWGLDGAVNAILTMGGWALVGGQFNNALPNPDDPEGTPAPMPHLAMVAGADAQLTPELSPGGAVSALGLYTAINSLICGGDFAPHRVATRAPGGAWQPLGPGLNGRPLAFAEYNGYLVIAGEFTAINGGLNARRVVMWLGTNYVPMLSGMNATVRALAVYNGALYAAGDFTAAGGTPISRIARWTGTAWLDVAGGVSGLVNARVNALLVHNGLLFVGGQFFWAGTPGNGVAIANNLAVWDGARWAATPPSNDGALVISSSGVPRNRETGKVHISQEGALRCCYPDTQISLRVGGLPWYTHRVAYRCLHTCEVGISRNFVKWGLGGPGDTMGTRALVPETAGITLPQWIEQYVFGTTKFFLHTPAGDRECPGMGIWRVPAIIANVVSHNNATTVRGRASLDWWKGPAGAFNCRYHFEGNSACCSSQEPHNWSMYLSRSAMYNWAGVPLVSYGDPDDPQCQSQYPSLDQTKAAALAQSVLGLGTVEVEIIIPGLVLTEADKAVLHKGGEQGLFRSAWAPYLLGAQCRVTYAAPSDPYGVYYNDSATSRQEFAYPGAVMYDQMPYVPALSRYHKGTMRTYWAEAIDGSNDPACCNYGPAHAEGPLEWEQYCEVYQVGVP